VNLELGKEVSVTLGNDGPRTGITKWTSGDRAGIGFDDQQANSEQKKAG